MEINFISVRIAGFNLLCQKLRIYLSYVWHFKNFFISKTADISPLYAYSLISLLVASVMGAHCLCIFCVFLCKNLVWVNQWVICRIMNQLAGVKIRAHVGTFAANIYVENSTLYTGQSWCHNNHRNVMLFKVYLHFIYWWKLSSQPVCQCHGNYVRLSLCSRSTHISAQNTPLQQQWSGTLSSPLGAASTTLFHLQGRTWRQSFLCGRASRVEQFASGSLSRG